MLKANLITFIVQSSQQFKAENVVSIVLMNYGATDLFFTHMGIKNVLKAGNQITGEPRQFQLDMGGFAFDIDFKLEFSGIADTGKVIIYHGVSTLNC